MEFDENKDEEIEDQYNDDDYVDIYSKGAIFGFSIFSFLYAGVLFMINLWAAGYKRAIGQVLAFIIFYYILSIYAISAFGIKIDLANIKMGTTGLQPTPEQVKAILTLTGLSLVVNTIGGLILTLYFFKKYFPDKDYYPKSILQPLIIFIVITLLFRFLL